MYMQMANLCSSVTIVQVDKLDILPGLPNKQTNKHRCEALEDFADFRQIVYDIVH